MTNVFDQQVFDFGEITNNKTVTFKTKLLKDREEIHYFWYDCGCTKPEWVDEGDDRYLKIYYSFGPLKKGEKRSVTKRIYVKLDPATEQFVSDKDGERVENPHLREVRLTVQGIVVGEDKY